ncbi:MAG: DUF1990 domain-containing protein [Opitutaceae bacterium]|nr:DUF1990 domain-containing protein [Opitutaceae bacterium]
MWFRDAPNAAAVGLFLASLEAAKAAHSYGPVGATRSMPPGRPPAGYTLDHNAQRIGDGEGMFLRACAALRAWRMFPAPWTSITPADAPIRAGMIVAMQARAFGLWWLNACRIVYVLEESGAGERRFGFAYGTLEAHVESGEERFSVELRADGSVWYDLLAFSRPHYWPVRLARPLARGLQARFVRESKAAMLAAAVGVNARKE